MNYIPNVFIPIKFNIIEKLTIKFYVFGLLYTCINKITKALIASVFR
jgi:hypothetical protein